MGAANPAYRHGRYSRMRPRGIREAFERLANDPERLSLQRDIQLLDSRIEELLDQLSPNPEPGTSPNWREITGLLGERRQLVAQETATMLKLRGVIPTEEVSVFMDVVLDAIGVVVTEPRDRARLVREMERIIGEKIPEAFPPVGEVSP